MNQSGYTFMEPNPLDPIIIVNNLLQSAPFLTVKLLAQVLFGGLLLLSFILVRQTALLCEYLKTDEGFVLRYAAALFWILALVLLLGSFWYL